jgi:hypothetical protein
MKKTNVFGLSVIIIYIVLCLGAWMTTVSCVISSPSDQRGFCEIFPGILSLPTVIFVNLVSEGTAYITGMVTSSDLYYFNIIVAQLINLYFLSKPYFLQRKQEGLIK